MKKRQKKKRFAQICILTAAIALGSAWHISGAQADGTMIPSEKSLGEMAVKLQEVASVEADFEIDENGVLVKYMGSGGDVKIPDGVTSIGRHAFSNCSSLTSITISESVTSIGGNAFEDCKNLSVINVASGNAKYSSQDGVLFDKKKTTLYAYPAGKGETAYQIPEGIISIGNSAFKGCVNLISVNIPQSVTSIGDGTFFGCSSLAFVSMPEGIKNIGLPYNVYNFSFEGGAFGDCISLTEIIIPESVTSIGGYAFSGCSSLTSVKIPEGVSCIDFHTFSGCNRLTSIELPESVTSIGESAFRSCSSLTSINLPESVTNIGKAAFRNCSSLTSIEIPGSVTSIQMYVFEDCSSLTSIEMPEGVTSIEWYAFSGCSSLRSIEIPEGVTSIGMGTFSGCSALTDITIPESITDIGGAFWNCSSLTNINIPKGVMSIEEGTFSGCLRLSAINVADSNLNYSAIDGILFNKEKSVLLAYPAGKEEEIYQIPESVTEICRSSFQDCNSLISINIPESVKSIGWYAFSGCSSLMSINIPVGVKSTVDKIEFDGCGIGPSTFRDCISLTSIIIPEEVMSIGDNAFSGCTNLVNITIPSSVQNIWDGAFANCPSLVIYCEKDSAAENHAKEHNIPYKYIGESDDTVTGGDTDTPPEISGHTEETKKPDSNKDAENSKKPVEDGDAKTPQTPSNTVTPAKPNTSKDTSADQNTGASKDKGKLKKQTITAKNVTKTYGAKAFSLGAKTNGGGKLTYTVSDKKVAVVSKAGKVTIKGCGVAKITVKAAANKNYASAAKTVTLTVKPAQQKISSLKSQKAKCLTVKWKKDAKANGYILQYSTDKKFKKDVKTVTVKKNGTTAKTISKLKSGRKYYVRICAYKNSGGKTIRGSYSPVKSVTVKK